MLTVKITLSNPEKQREPVICTLVRDAIGKDPITCEFLPYVKILGIVPANSIKLYMLCETAEAPRRLFYLHNNGELKKIIEDWLRGFEAASNVVILTIYLVDYYKCLSDFGRYVCNIF